MATCVNCSKTGWTVSVKHGACEECLKRLAQEVDEADTSVAHAEKRINAAKMLETRVEYYQEILQQLARLQAYEARGVSRQAFSLTCRGQKADGATAAIGIFADALDQDIADEFEGRIKDALNKAAGAASPRKRIVILEKVAERLAMMTAHMRRPERLASGRATLRVAMLDARLDETLEPARRAEFKGLYDEAAEVYREALFLISQDEAANGSSRAADIQRRLEAVTEGRACKYCKRTSGPGPDNRPCAHCGASDAFAPAQITPTEPIHTAPQSAPQHAGNAFVVAPAAATAPASVSDNLATAAVGCLMLVALVVAVAIGARACSACFGRSDAVPATQEVPASATSEPSSSAPVQSARPASTPKKKPVAPKPKNTVAPVDGDDAGAAGF